ncbi:MAG: response regulator, partial [Deltaproteobacteria bacterium]|nr:response regulator [Deltaproteobacteria bacterium]
TDRLVYASVNCHFLYDEDGTTIGVEGSLRDITDRKLAEEVIHQNEIRMRAITDSAQDAIIMMDPDGLISYWNPAAERILGYTDEEAVGQDLHVLIVPSRYHEAYRSAFPAFLQTGQGAAIGKKLDDLYARRRDGVEIPVELSLSAINLNGGINGGWHAVGLLRDVTERKQAQEALQETVDELAQTNSYLEEATAKAVDMAAQAERANSAKSEFLANMSHEIRTPMNGVIGMAGLLLDTELNPDQRDCAETIRNSADLLLSLINDILDFSKIEAGKLELEMLPFDLRTTLEDLSDLLSFRAHEKDLEFACLVEPEVPACLKGDPGRLRQILTNLIGNGIKFTTQGEIVVHVTLDHEDEQQAKIRFEVRDTGLGIPAQKVSALFQPFTQVDSSTTRKFGGTGLGLSISKRLAELMGGEIGVASLEGRGSTFWFTALLEKQPPDKVSSPGPPINIDLTKTRILVVDDNSINRRVFAGILNSWHCRFDEAADAVTAMNLLRAAIAAGDPFQLAILDMLMPEIDGETLGKMIKEDSLLKNTILVMMTSAGRRGDAARLEKIGFGAYLTKPVRQSQLLNCVMTVLGGKAPAETSPQRIITRHTVAENLKRKIRILLAEDNITNQKVAIRYIEKMGYRVDAVANGKEAVETLKTIPYDLVLMDVQMPELDGYEATKMIRNNDVPVLDHQIPIIAMTANAMKGDREKCLEAGMDDYVSKPIMPADLAQVIDRWISAEPAVEDKQTVEKEDELKVSLDRSILVDRFDGDEEFYAEILDVFLQDGAEEIAALEKAVAKSDAQLIRELGHKLKGASGNVAAMRLQDLAFKMEQAGKAGLIDNALETFKKIQEEFELLKQLIHSNKDISSNDL